MNTKRIVLGLILGLFGVFLADQIFASGLDRLMQMSRRMKVPVQKYGAGFASKIVGAKKGAFNYFVDEGTHGLRIPIHVNASSPELYSQVSSMVRQHSSMLPYGGPKLKSILVSEDRMIGLSVEKIEGSTLAELVRTRKLLPEHLHAFDQMQLSAVGRGQLLADAHLHNLIFETSSGRLRPIDVNVIDSARRLSDVSPFELGNTIAARLKMGDHLEMRGLYNRSQFGGVSASGISDAWKASFERFAPGLYEASRLRMQ